MKKLIKDKSGEIEKSVIISNDKDNFHFCRFNEKSMTISDNDS
jgi:hypothetical protein